jgi:hypothetical protein
MAATVLWITGRNWAKESGASFSNGSWALPIANVADSRPSIYAKSTSNSPNTNTSFHVDLGAQKRIDLIWFVGLLTSTAGTITIAIGNDPTFGTNLYSIIETTWPTDTTSTDNWGNSTSTGAYLNLTYEALNYPRFFPLTSTVTARYISVLISDTGNSTPVQIGCFGASEIASFKFTYNWQMTFNDETQQTLAVSGTPYFDIRRRKRRLNIGFVPMLDTDIYAKFFDWLAYKGQREPFVILPFAEAAYEARLEKVGLYGIRSSAPSFTNPMTTLYNLGLQVDEL